MLSSCRIHSLGDAVVLRGGSTLLGSSCTVLHRTLVHPEWPMVTHEHRRCQPPVARGCRGCVLLKEPGSPLKWSRPVPPVPSPHPEAVSRAIAVRHCPSYRPIWAVADEWTSVEVNGTIFCSPATLTAMAVSMDVPVADRYPPEASCMLLSRAAELSQLV